MESVEVKLFTDLDTLLKTCIEYNVSLFNFKYITSDTYKLHYNMNAAYPILYLTLWNQQNLVGILKQSVITGYQSSEFSDTIPDQRFINYVVISDQYRSQGYGQYLIKQYFQFLNQQNLNELYLSPYSKEGFQYLKSKIEKLANEFNIKICNKSYCFES